MHSEPAGQRSAEGLDRLSLLANIATRLLTSEEPEEIAADIYFAVAEHLGVDVFLNYLVEPDGSGIRLSSSFGISPAIAEEIAHLQFGQAACGTVAVSRKPIIASNVHESSDAIFAVLRSLGVRAYACHPLVAGHQMIGTLAFASRKRNEFTEEEIRLMATIASQAAVAIERSRVLSAYREEQSARRNAEAGLNEAVRDSQARLQTVLDILPVAVFISDINGRLLLVNRAGEKTWGPLPRAMNVGEYSRFRGKLSANGAPLEPGDWGLPKALKGEEVADREIEIEAFDGKRRTILNSAVPIRGGRGQVVGAVAVDVDITERKQAETELRRVATVMSQASQMANLGAWQIEFTDLSNRDASPLTWSDHVYRIFGYQPGEVPVTNELFFSHVHPDDRCAVQDQVRKAIEEGTAYAAEHRIITRDGRERVVFEHAEIIYNDKREPVRMIGAVQDITEQKRNEQALVEVDRRKTEFLATLSHELRNPLAAIRYALELLNMPDAGSEVRSKEVIERQMQHLVRLVDDLLDVTRITSNKVRLRKVRVELSKVLQHAVEAAEPQIRAAGHKFTVELPRERVFLDADPDRLAQVITNLLNNAARYTPAGGNVTLRTDAVDSSVVISVADNGVGLRKEDQERVFEMFAQAGEPGHGGLGIGLALAKGLTEMHGGKLQVTSHGPGQGSEFKVTLPRASAPSIEMAMTVEKQLDAPRRRVLVVDDNDDAAEMAAMLLKLQGHEVRVAPDGPTALVIASQFKPDVGLFDIGLPGMSGYELARRVRENGELASMYLIAVTGWGQEEDVKQAREAGFDAHVTKPAEPQAIEAAIANAARRL